MAATKIFVSYLEDFLDDLPVSRLEVVWTSWKSSDKVVWTSRNSSGLPGSRLDFQEAVWTSRKSSGLHGSLLTEFPFHNRSERLDLEDFWDDLPVSRLEVVWTSWKSSDKVVGTSCKVVWTSCKVVWTSCKVVWKSSELPKSLLTKSSELHEVMRTS
ncbi:hypothetical protein Bca4012_033333 [Brassica carinata]